MANAAEFPSLQIDATYDPADNKIRLRASARLPRELYDRVRAAGFIWAPKQDLFVAPMWTPERADLAIELAGELGDEDTSLVERAEERAERFEEYQDKRADDANRAHAAVAAIADNIPLGQPILVGHHSERHARRDAEKIRNGMARAVKMWETSEYWERRAKGAVKHAKYKELPGVRLRRIKGLEADKRRNERRASDSRTFLAAWRKEGLTSEGAQKIANFDRGCPFGTWGDLEKANASGDEGVKLAALEKARGNAVYNHERTIADAGRWIAHLDLRLAYERAMLGDIPEPVKVKRSLPPMVNYPGEGFHHMTKAEWAAKHADYKGSRTVNGYRVRTAVIHTNGSSALCPVYLTDSKRTDPPEGREASAAEVPRFKPYAPAPGASTYVAPSAAPKPEAAPFQAMKESLRAGVATISAPELFPTPPELAARMVEIAGIETAHRVLEPSAGTGAIVKAIREAGSSCELVAVETSARLCDALRPYATARAVDLRCSDFLSTSIPCDRVVMNPPFSAEVEHVTHAWGMLKPSGVLVSVMSAGVTFRQDRRTVEFRQLVAAHGSLEELPDGMFQSAGTGVRTVLVTLRKDPS